MEGIVSYTDDISKFISGKQYAGKNIQTSDGKTAYITKTGIAKPYTSVNELSNINGCKNSFERIDSSWGDMGIPIGSLMVKGQSCGNETSYVQSMPPKTTFDWKYYIESNPNLNLTTEQQAKDHWTSTGIHQGLLPNSSILDLMSNVGKIGYVDVNTTLHTVPQEAYAYTGKYKFFNSGNIIGSTMKDCSIPAPPVKYGDQIYIKYTEQHGSMNQQSILEFGNNKTNLFLRPPVGSDALTGTPIKYGDTITIAVSSSNVKTNDCGWWGCKVGYVNPTTSILSFGSGGNTGGQTFTIIVPSGTKYKNGSEIKYNDPFSLSTSMESVSWKSEDQVDYGGNDRLGWVENKSIDECKLLCSTKPGCVGFIQDKRRNRCWFKDKLSNRKQLNHANTYILSDPIKETKFGYINNNIVMFGTNDQSLGKNIFTFQTIGFNSYTTDCDLKKLQRDCNSDTTCSGFIHSTTENTWQKIMNNSTASVYKVTDTQPNVYVKEATVDMKDKTCQPGTPQFIDSDMFDHYPKGKDFEMNNDQCNRPITTGIIKTNQQKYENENKKYQEQGEYMVKNYPQKQAYTKQTNQIYNQLNTKTTEYKNVLKTIQQKKEKYNDTFHQQNIDLATLEYSNKSYALVWGLSSLIMIGIVVIVKNKQ